MNHQSTTVTLQHRGVEYTLNIQFDAQRAAEKLLARALRYKARRATSLYNAVRAKIIAEVPIK